MRAARLRRAPGLFGSHLTNVHRLGGTVGPNVDMGVARPALVEGRTSAVCWWRLILQNVSPCFVLPRPGRWNWDGRCS